MSLYDKNSKWIHEFHMFTYQLSITWDTAHTEALKKTLKFCDKHCLCQVKPIINWNVTWYTFGKIAKTQKVEKTYYFIFLEIEVVFVY